MAATLVFARTGSRVALSAGAMAAVASALSSLYYMAYFTPLIVAFGIVTLLRETRWRTPEGRTSLAIALAASMIVLAPFVMPYMHVQRALGVIRSRAEVEAYSLTLDTYYGAVRYLVPTLILAAT